MYQADGTRYETMKYNRCGKSGLKLPEVSLGLWHNFGSTAVYENMKSFFCQQTFMIALLNDMAIFHNQYHIRLTDRG